MNENLTTVFSSNFEKSYWFIFESLIDFLITHASYNLTAVSIEFYIKVTKIFFNGKGYFSLNYRILVCIYKFKKKNIFLKTFKDLS